MITEMRIPSPQRHVLSSYPTRAAMNSLSDEELVTACQRGIDGAFECLIRRHKKTITAMLYRVAPDWHDSSDIQQQVYIRIWRSLWQLRNPASFKTWLNKIVTNLFYDELRDHPRQYQFVSLDEPIKSSDGSESSTREIADSSHQPEDRALRNELSGVLAEAMAKIPERFRTAVILRDVEGLSYEEIADLTATELGTVKSRISRARTKIQRQLKSYLKECA